MRGRDTRDEGGGVSTGYRFPRERERGRCRDAGCCVRQPSSDELAEVAKALGLETYLIGDALAPRTAEEAVFEGLSAATYLVSSQDTGMFHG